MLAGGTIAMRKMRRMHYMVVSTYTNLFLAVTSVTAVACMPGLGFGYLSEFGGWSWFYFSMIATLSILEQTSKFCALKYQEAAKLQRLAFLPNVWQFCVDLLIVHKDYSTMQFVGFALLFSFYSLEMGSYFCRSKRELDKETQFRRA